MTVSYSTPVPGLSFRATLNNTEGSKSITVDGISHPLLKGGKIIWDGFEKIATRRHNLSSWWLFATSIKQITGLILVRSVFKGGYALVIWLTHILTKLSQGESSHSVSKTFMMHATVTRTDAQLIFKGSCASHKIDWQYTPLYSVRQFIHNDSLLSKKWLTSVKVTYSRSQSLWWMCTDAHVGHCVIWPSFDWPYPGREGWVTQIMTSAYFM